MGRLRARLETTDFSGSRLLDRRDRWRIGFGYEHRNIEIPFTVTGPLGRTFSRTVDLAADGLSFDANVTLAERWRLYVGLEELRLRARSRRAAPDRELELSQRVHADAREQLPRPRPLHRRQARFRPSDGAELAPGEVTNPRSTAPRSKRLKRPCCFRSVRRVDLEVNLGQGRSDFFKTATTAAYRS